MSEVVHEGMKIPEICLPGSDDKDHCLSEFAGRKLILYFYPKDNTAGCSKEAVSFAEHYERLLSLGAVVVGVSRDSVASHKKFIEKYELPFLLLSDKEEKLCNAFGVIKDKNMYGKVVRGIERSTFIIDETGSVIKELRKVKADGHAEIVLELIGELNRKG